jgi:5S rRNA maturation endonuclease (ribonuclease M5)
MNSLELKKKIDELFEELIIINQTIPIIVEGKNDEAALRKIGLKGTIFRLNTGQSILNFCEDIAKKNSEIILLTDWDKKGIQLFKRLIENFKPTKVNAIDTYWRKFRRLCSKEISEVEELIKYLIVFDG